MFRTQTQSKENSWSLDSWPQQFSAFRFQALNDIFIIFLSSRYQVPVAVTDLESRCATICGAQILSNNVRSLDSRTFTLLYIYVHACQCLGQKETVLATESGLDLILKKTDQKISFIINLQKLLRTVILKGQCLYNCMQN